MFNSKFFLGVIVVVMVALMLGACAKSATESTTPTVTPTDEVKVKEVNQEESQKIAKEFVKTSPTFVFDGISDSLKLTDSSSLSRCQFCWAFTFEFESRHAGYGDRTGQMLAQVITLHKVTLIVEQGEIKYAEMDGKWDMIKQKMLGSTVGGPCEYLDIPGMATIISIRDADPVSNNCKDAVEVVFDFAPEDADAVENYRFPNWSDKGQHLTVGGNMNPPRAGPIAAPAA